MKKDREEGTRDSGLGTREGQDEDAGNGITALLHMVEPIREGMELLRDGLKTMPKGTVQTLPAYVSVSGTVNADQALRVSGLCISVDSVGCLIIESAGMLIRVLADQDSNHFAFTAHCHTRLRLPEILNVSDAVEEVHSNKDSEGKVEGRKAKGESEHPDPDSALSPSSLRPSSSVPLVSPSSSLEVG